MQVHLQADGVSAVEVQEALEASWSSMRSDGTIAMELAELGFDDQALAIASPLEAVPGKEGFGAVELIMIGATAGLAARLSDRALEQLWVQYLWPRLKVRFGRNIEPKADGEPSQ